MSETQSREAMFWSPAQHGVVSCELCPHLCKIADGITGFCGARENRGSVLAAASYGQITSLALDPIEKKPLYMYQPGKQVLSVGSYGCNLRCQFCQNHGISMEYGNREYRFATPEQITDLAVQFIPDGNIGVAYTYNEPLVGYEFVYDCAKLVRKNNLANVLVTNGYINRRPLELLLPLIDVMNIDLKGFTGEFYANLGGSLSPVTETISLAAHHCHVEVTTLVIPDENEYDIEKLAAWLASINPDIPLHLSRFFPRYKYSDREPTPPETIHRLCNTARKHLRYVFGGNM